MSQVLSSTYLGTQQVLRKAYIFCLLVSPGYGSSWPSPGIHESPTWPLTLALAQVLSSHLQRPIWAGSPVPAASDGRQAQGEGSEVVRSNTSRAGAGLGQRGRGPEETGVPGMSARGWRMEGRWAGRGPSKGAHTFPRHRISTAPKG